VCVCVCVCVCFNIILILAEIPSKWIFYFKFQHQNLLQNSFTPYVLHASRNILIFIGQRKKYCQQYKLRSISPFKLHPSPFTSYLSAKHKNIFWNYSVVFVYLSSISIFHGNFFCRSLLVRHCRISRRVDMRK
jgi:hypothetical protein